MSLEFTSNVYEIPAEDPSAVRENIESMIQYTELGTLKEYDGGDLGFFISRTLQHLRVHLQRLHGHEEAGIDLLAWIARNLLEVKLIAGYALLSEENLQKTLLKDVIDLRNLDEIWFKEGRNYNEQEAADFKQSLEDVEEFIEEEDLDPGEGWLTIPQMAKATGEEYLQDLSKWLSKYVHPTPVLLFGKESFMKGEDARKAVLKAAQHCAARLLEDIPGDAERIRSQRAT